MKRKDIERMLKESRELTPDAALRRRILDQKVPAVDVPNVARSASERPVRSRMAWRMIPIAAALLLVMTATLTGVGMYRAEYETVYIDINPSVELSVNRFERVIDVTYLNTDAEDCFEALALTNKGVEKSIDLIIDALDEDGYLKAQNTLYIGVSGKGEAQAEKLLEKVSARANQAQTEKGHTVEIRSASITDEERQAAKDMGISPNKYQLIEEIVSDNPSFDPSDLRDMKMRDLREMLGKKEKEHKNDSEEREHPAGEKEKPAVDKSEKENGKKQDIPTESAKNSRDEKKNENANVGNPQERREDASDKITGKNKKASS